MSRYFCLGVSVSLIVLATILTVGFILLKRKDDKAGIRKSEDGTGDSPSDQFDYLIGKSVEIVDQTGLKADLNGKRGEVMAVTLAGDFITIKLPVGGEPLELNKDSFVILDSLTPVQLAHLFAKESLVKLVGLNDGMSSNNGRLAVVTGIKGDRVAVELDDNSTNFEILPRNLVRPVDADANTRLSFAPQTRVMARGLSGSRKNLNGREGVVARRFNSGSRTVGVFFGSGNVIVLPVSNLSVLDKEYDQMTANSRFPLGSRVALKEGHGFNEGAQGTVHSNMDVNTRRIKVVMDSDRKPYDISIDALQKAVSTRWFANAPGEHDPVRFPFGAKVAISRFSEELNGKMGLVVSDVEKNAVSVFVEAVDKTEVIPLQNLVVSE